MKQKALGQKHGVVTIQQAAQGLRAHSSHEQLATALEWHNGCSTTISVTSPSPCFLTALTAFLLLIGTDNWS